MGWIDRGQEVKAELTEALRKVPDVLTVNHELRMRDMEKKIEAHSQGTGESEASRARPWAG